MLADVLERARPGERVVVTGFGQGVDILVFEVTAQIERRRNCGKGVAGHLARRVADANYNRYLFHRGLLALNRGIRAEQDQKQPGTSLWRNRKAVLGLVGGRCTETGTVQVPRSEIGVGLNGGSRHAQEDHPLADRPARIVTFTADHLTYSPAPPAYYGMIDFDGGGRMVTEFADVEGEEIEVGREMRMMFRIKALDEQRDFTKYFWKAAPAG
jgi:uncharacterized OB-fold protein/antitoxin (DNA-binding transcriptional repressor) of toxin-antitoxin stability system